MSSNNTTLPTDAARSSQNRVSLDGGAAGDNTTSGRHSRKRKQEEAVVPAIPDTVASLSERTIAPPTTEDNDNTVALALTDEQEITLIVTMRLSSDNVEDVAEAMDSLVMMLERDHGGENRKTAFRRGAPLAVVQVMRRHGISHRIQSLGALVLSTISCYTLDYFHHDIIAVGGLSCCLEAMSQHDNNTGVQAYGCLFIGNLWCLPVVRKKVVEDGGLKAVITATEKNKENTEVQRWGCHALEALLHEETSTWAEVAVDVGSIDLVIAAMSNHSNDAKLQQYGCEFLCHLSNEHEDYGKVILVAKGLVPVVEAQRIHIDDAKVVKAARNAYDAIIANY